ncbi:MAG: hypothetical protein JO291_08450 [Acidimicrobiia bacterium]|nr:hypothetical protein [Acidimicrobiia bacterium]
MGVEVESAVGREPTVLKRADAAHPSARLAHEAEVLDAVRGPGVVTLVSFDADDDGAELRTAWAGHHTMATIGTLPVAPAARLMTALAETVSRMHELEIAHTRLTPDHVVLTADGQPMLCGFGRASRGDPRSMESDVVALGELLTSLLGAGGGGLTEPVPARRVGRRHAEPERAALLTLADRASAEGLGARLSAATFAEALRGVVPPTGPSSGRDDRGVRRLASVVAALTGIVLVLIGVRQLLATQPQADAVGDAPAAPATAPPSTATTSPTSSLATTEPSTSTAPVTQPSCTAVNRPAADVDGDGCPEPYTVDGAHLLLGGVTYELGRPGDLTAIGDWDCDGRATPAIVRPSTGEVFVFERWAATDRAVTVRAATVVHDATGIRARRSDARCPQLVVTRSGHPPFTVPVRR